MSKKEGHTPLITTSATEVLGTRYLITFVSLMFCNSQYLVEYLCRLVPTPQTIQDSRSLIRALLLTAEVQRAADLQRRMSDILRAASKLPEDILHGEHTPCISILSRSGKKKVEWSFSMQDRFDDGRSKYLTCGLLLFSRHNFLYMAF